MPNDHFYESSPLLLATVSREGILQTFNPVWQQRLGMDYSATERGFLLNLIHPDDRAGIAGCLRERSDYQGELRLLRREAEPLWVSLRLHWLDDEAVFAVTAEDETRQRETQAQAQLQSARRFAERTIQVVREPLVVLDNETRIQAVNVAFCQLLRVAETETVDHLLGELPGGQWDNPAVRAFLSEDNAPDVHFEMRYEFPSAGWKTLLLNARRIEMDGLGAGWTVLSVNEMGAQEQAPAQPHGLGEHDALEGLTRVMQAAVEQADDAVVITTGEMSSPGPKIVFANSAFTRMTGYTLEEIIGQASCFLENRHMGSDLAKLLRKTLTHGEAFHAETADQRKDGTPYQAEWTINPVHDPGNRITHFVFVGRDVTERRREEHALQESEARFKAVAEALPVAVVITRLSDNAVLFANERYCEIIGMPRTEVLGTKAADFLCVPEDQQQIEEEIQRGGSVRNREVQIRRADGSTGWVLVSISRISLDGSPAALTGFQDITLAKQLERDLVESEQRFRSLFEHSPISLWMLDYSQIKRYLDDLREKGVRDFQAYFEQQPQALQECEKQLQIVDVNRATVALYHAPDRETLLRRLHELLPSESTEVTQKFLVAVADGQTSYHTELVNSTFDGERIDLDVTWTVVPGFEKSLAKVIRSVVDISESKRNERALREYGQRIGLLHRIDAAILSTQSPTSVAQSVVETLPGMLGCSHARMISFDLGSRSLRQMAVFPPDAGASEMMLTKLVAREGIPASLLRGEIYYYEDIERAARIPAELKQSFADIGARSSVVVPLMADGQLIGALDVISPRPHNFTQTHMDILREIADQLAITLHKAHLDEQIQAYAQELEARVAERTEQLRQAKEHIETVLASTSDAMIVARTDGSIEQVNPAFEVLFGISAEATAALTLTSLVDAPSADRLESILHSISASTASDRAELVCIRQDGTTFDADAAFAPVMDGQSVSIICSLRDMTARKRAENELRSALEHEKDLSNLKMRFISMVSHEFRTPLSSILSSSDLMKYYADRMSTEKKLEHLDRIQAQVRRLTDLLEDILFMNKSDIVGIQTKITEFDFDAFCRGIVDEMELTAPTHSIHFTSTIYGMKMAMDAKLMRQVITNLLSNAVKYSPSGSSIEFDLCREDDKLVVSIRDHGIGIPEEDHKHLFEIFHRATNVGTTPGTGVGLTIVRRAVEAHGGTIQIESAVGAGTTVTLTFPSPQHDQHIG